MEDAPVLAHHVDRCPTPCACLASSYLAVGFGVKFNLLPMAVHQAWQPCGMCREKLPWLSRNGWLKNNPAWQGLVPGHALCFVCPLGLTCIPLHGY